MRFSHKLVAIGALLTIIFLLLSSPVSSAFANSPNKCKGLLKALEKVPPDSPAYKRLRDNAEKDCGPELDRAALTALYKSTNGNGWSNHQYWLSQTPHCDWYGVRCTHDQRVYMIVLSGNQLNGPLPPELGYLSNLLWLVLSDNQLSGPVPPQLGSLENLAFLYLDRNGLSGPIPPELSNLGNLAWLYLNDNRLSGPVPPELANLNKLQGLDLRNNQLSGPIPPELGDLGNLQEFQLSSNQLSGPIPSQLGNLSAVWVLDLSLNQLSGPIPPELENLSSLQLLYLWPGNPELCVSTQALLDFLGDLADGYSGPDYLCGP